MRRRIDIAGDRLGQHMVQGIRALHLHRRHRPGMLKHQAQSFIDREHVAGYPFSGPELANRRLVSSVTAAPRHIRVRFL